MRLFVRLTPGAAADALRGVGTDARGRAVLKAAVTAPPEAGKANRALIKLLSKRMKRPKSAFGIVRGETDRSKTLTIAGDPRALSQDLTTLTKSLESRPK